MMVWKLKANDTEEEDDDDQASNENGPETINTDRPDFSNSPTTVGRGRIQLETGYTFTYDRNASRQVYNHSVPEALLRIGMFNDWFEWRFQDNFDYQRTRSQGVSTIDRGGEDFLAGFKVTFAEQAGCLPKTGLIVEINFPTGSAAFGSRDVEPTITFAYNWEIIEDLLSLTGNSIIGRREDDDDIGAYFQVAQSFSMELDWTERLSSFSEFFIIAPHSSTSPTVVPTYNYQAGFLYLVTNNFQLDIRAGLGLNDPADDFFTGAGVSYRY